METQKYISLGNHIVRFGGESKCSDSPAQDVEVHVVIDHVKDTEHDYECAYVMAGFGDAQWDTFTQGDIYTDPTFKEGIKAIVKEAGYLNFDEMFGYSESGMQHEFYAHFDLAVNDKLKEAENNFFFDWQKLHEVTEAKELTRELERLDQEREVKTKRLCELKKKYNI